MKNKRIVVLGMCVGTAHLQSILSQKKEILVLPNIDTIVPEKEPHIDYLELISEFPVKGINERNVIPINFYSKHKRKK